MIIQDVLNFLRTIAPETYQENYDNSGLLVGNSKLEISGVLCALDCIESVIDEAIEKNCNLVVAHHPILFSSLKSILGKNYIERTIIKAIKHDIAIYAIHTNLDNMLYNGVNSKICEKLGLVNTRILIPGKNKLKKLIAYIPIENTDEVLAAIHEAGAGNIGNYASCSFLVEGQGRFTPNERAKPAIGQSLIPEKVKENRIEVIFPIHAEGAVLKALMKTHPYEEVAYFVESVDNIHQEIGAGMIGELDQPMDTKAFLQMVKDRFGVELVRHTKLTKDQIKTVAVCGGSGSAFLPNAIGSGADIFITADFKYHQFFDADGQIIIADIGHYESEQFTSELLFGLIQKNLVTSRSIFRKLTQIR